jgi:deoxyadenosine/deoxycytidine kinase
MEFQSNNAVASTSIDTFDFPSGHTTKETSTSPKPLIRYISIEGNIGAGKSTLFENIQKFIGEYNMNTDNHIVFIREPVDIWEKVTENNKPILELFYENPKVYASMFQTMVLASQIKLIQETIQNNPQCTTIISERSLESGHYLFTKMLVDDGFMRPIEYQIYKLLFETQMHETLKKNGVSGKADTILYLDIEPTVCSQRIKIRSRKGEESITLEYLQKCEMYYKKWLFGNSVDECANTDTGPVVVQSKQNVIRIFDNADVEKIVGMLL